MIIGMAVHNNASSLEASLQSVFSQEGIRGKFLLVLVNDSSIDHWQNVVNHVADKHRTVIINVEFAKAYKTRNLILWLSRKYARNLKTIVRLDADDYFFDNRTLCQIQSRFRREYFSFNCGLRRPGLALIGSNYQICNGTIQAVPNLADNKFFKRKYLLEQLEGMSIGIFKTELPSCNVVIRPEIPIFYPAITSGEDHWFTVDILTSIWKKDVMIDEELMHSVYSISGSLSGVNRKKSSYLKSRQLLLKWAYERTSQKELICYPRPISQLL
ncbi:MAG: glycosyltransferase family 2 protein [Candidatus Brocadiae bacterium]|nr:glycosyltransferase family 2 protein [Candidatus Brocadiia bacterium]